MPTVQIIIAIDPRDVSTDGDIRFDWRVTSSSIGPTDAQTPASLGAGLRDEVAAIERLSGTAVVTPRGLAKEVLLDLAPAVGVKPMVDQVREVLRDVAAPFPEEEVGRGARWQKLSRPAGRDARVTQTETFTLANVDGAQGTLSDVLTQTAPAQTLRAPGALAGPQAHMDSMLASGDAETRFDLSRLVPQTRYRGTTTMVLSARPPGDDVRRLTMLSQVTLSGTAR